MAEKEVALKKKILKVINFLKDKIELDYVVLFGSYASGKTHKYSDVDLAIVSNDFEKYSLEEKATLSSKVKLNCDIDIEVHPFSISQFNNARPTNFMGYILSCGKFYLKNKKLVA